MSVDLFDRIRFGEYKFIILSGAGVSTNSGIPDYRSGNRVLLDYLTDKSLSSEQFYADSRFGEMVAMFENAEPTLSHHLAKELYDRGLLLRVHTQNIDGLYQKTGLPEDMVVEFHGSVFKKNVVRNGEDIRNDVIEKVLTDFSLSESVVVLIMGTSLESYPFRCVPNLAPKGSIRVMVGYGVDKIGTYKGGYHETGISDHSFPITFSYWKTTFEHPDNPSLNQHKKIKRNVRGNLEWGWGNHTRKKKWKDYRVVGDVDKFSRELMSCFENL